MLWSSQERDGSSFTNVSEINFSSNNETDPDVPLIVSEIIAAYLIFIALEIVMLNTLVIVVLVKRRRKIRSFQICAMAMAIADILFALTVHPMSISSALGTNPDEMFKSKGCIYFGMLALFFGTYDMVTHALISIIRFVNLCNYRKAIEWVSTGKVCAYVLLAVLYSLSWSIGPAFQWGRYQTFEVGCTIAFEDKTSSGRSFVLCAFVFVFFLPLAVMCSCYALIVVESGKQKKILVKAGNISSGSRKYTIGTRSFRTYAVQIKLAKRSAVIAICYVLAWLPYAVVCLLETFGQLKRHNEPNTFRIISGLFCKSAAGYNPVLYLFLSKDFRGESKKVLLELSDQIIHGIGLANQRSSSVSSGISSANRTLSFSLSKRQSLVGTAKTKASSLT